ARFVRNKGHFVASGTARERSATHPRATFPSLDHVPIAFITAKEGKNVYRVLNLAQNLYKQATARVSTGDLNRLVRQAVERQSPPMRQNRLPRIYYATQVAAAPPTVVLFTNGPHLVGEPDARCPLRAFREELPFRERPIKLHLRTKNRDDQPPAESRPDGRAAREVEKKREPDLSGLEFRSTVTEEELQREGKRYESDLWRDL